ncbi:MAG: hypothetical protein K2G37_01505 [Clostridia bacterium]|nr:hypothetical protein [Clostridia bacterium]MDE7328526.1 hypothetical protein [Clostridia bacterium]
MNIEKKELLRYLGYKGQEYTPKLDSQIDKAIELCLSLITPRSVIKKFALRKDPLSLVGADMKLLGDNIAKHLSGCEEIYIMGATVGFEVEKRVSHLMSSDPLAAVLLDSASICAIESYCDDLCEELQAANATALTSRFSCGYGDFPLYQQKDFVRVLELPKRIGVFMNEESFMLSPQKTVTAVVGIKKYGKPNKTRCMMKCVGCENKECVYRSES